MKIKMLKTVVTDMPIRLFRTPETKLIYGQIYQATANKNGAVSGICENGVVLGVKPDEFEIIEAGKQNG